MTRSFHASFHVFSFTRAGVQPSLVGLLIFFSKGSLIQLVVASMFTMMYMAAISWALPYQVMGANFLKIGTECALLGTLIISILLKVDLENQDLSEGFIGMLLILNTAGLPGCALIAAFFSFGDDWQYQINRPKMAEILPPFGFACDEYGLVETITDAERCTIPRGSTIIEINGTKFSQSVLLGLSRETQPVRFAYSDPPGGQAQATVDFQFENPISMDSKFENPVSMDSMDSMEVEPMRRTSSVEIESKMGSVSPI